LYEQKKFAAYNYGSIIRGFYCVRFGVRFIAAFIDSARRNIVRAAEGNYASPGKSCSTTFGCTRAI
jgi:hypothetical protein